MAKYGQAMGAGGKLYRQGLIKMNEFVTLCARDRKNSRSKVGSMSTYFLMPAITPSCSVYTSRKKPVSP